MTKPQTAKDLVELYDEYCSSVNINPPLVALTFHGFINYLRKQTEVVKEDDWDDHKSQTVGVEFPAPQTNLIRKEDV